MVSSDNTKKTFQSKVHRSLDKLGGGVGIPSEQVRFEQVRREGILSGYMGMLRTPREQTDMTENTYR